MKTAKEWLIEKYPDMSDNWNRTANDDEFLIEAMEEYASLKVKEAIDNQEKWHSQRKKPRYDKESNSSVQVLLYSPELKVYSIGWFDYELDKWMHIADEEMEDFVWQLPNPPKEF